MKVCNIKISLFFETELFQKVKSNIKIIWKEGEWIITQYQHSPKLINVTGIKCKEHITEVIKLLELKFCIKCVKFQIDSAMLSHKDNKKIQLTKVYKYLHQLTKEFYIDFQPELFTGMFIKPYCRDYPTVNLFYTGSYQLLGGKSFDKIEYTAEIVKVLIEKCENGV